ncbi:Glutathione S-transferase protein [Gonapodya sp. JEL0774]|nr:Glutathione S-transferase protein [Gonapodya sp. JEL0774]
MAPVDYTATHTPTYTNSLPHAPVSEDKLTLFTSIVCPFAQRTHLTLLEGAIPFHKVEIDLQNKPSWYNAEVNPRSKVPALKEPGVEGSLIESAILSEYLAEKFAPSLLPPTPFLRYLGRLLVDVQTNLSVYTVLKIKTDTPEGQAEETAAKEKLIAGIKEFTSILSQASSTGPFFLGESVSLPDLLTIPFLTRTLWLFEYFIGESLIPDTPEFARFWAWFNALSTRPSFKETFPTVERLAQGIIARGFGVVRPGAEKKRQAAIAAAPPVQQAA